MKPARRRVLLVEDEYLIAILMEELLSDLSHELVGTAGSLDDALRMARSLSIDLALLDLRIGAAMTYPVADILISRGIPFAFVTGAESVGSGNAYAAVPVLRKPFGKDGLAAMLARLEPPGTAIAPP